MIALRRTHAEITYALIHVKMVIHAHTMPNAWPKIIGLFVYAHLV